jgi:5-methyltetrahydropteroyltriglutamate--homocysteine methyltransferase
MSTGFRADNIGSLLRPAELLRARADYGEGHITLKQLRQVEDQAILAALDMQRASGIDVFTDGEYRRGMFTADITQAVEGFVRSDRAATANWRGPHRDIALAARKGDRQLVVGGKLSKKGRLVPDEAPFLREHAPGPFKICVPSLSYWSSRYKPGITDSYYSSRGAMIRDLAAALRDEVLALIKEGASYIQLDAPSYTVHLMDLRGRQELMAMGLDPDEALDDTLAGDNELLEEIHRHPGVTSGIHLCRGNNRSAWAAEGSYEPIAEKLFSSLRADKFLLEFDSERAGGFEPLRFVPKGKSVVLGLITTKEAQLETEDELRCRIEEAARYVSLDRLAISTQCGFASTAPGNLISWDDQRRKLELVARTARKIWG